MFFKSMYDSFIWWKHFKCSNTLDIFSNWTSYSKICIQTTAHIIAWVISKLSRYRTGEVPHSPVWFACGGPTLAASVLEEKSPCVTIDQTLPSCCKSLHYHNHILAGMLMVQIVSVQKGGGGVKEIKKRKTSVERKGEWEWKTGKKRETLMVL